MSFFPFLKKGIEGLDSLAKGNKSIVRNEALTIKNKGDKQNRKNVLRTQVEEEP